MTVAVSRARGRGQGDPLRLDREHLGLCRRLRRALRSSRARSSFPKARSRSEARPGDGARGAGRRSARELRPGARASPLALGRRLGRGRQFDQPRPHRGQKTVAFEIAAALGGASRTSTRSRSETPATSPPPGRAAPGAPATRWRRDAADARVSGRRAAPIVRGEARRRSPRHSPPRSRSGIPRRGREPSRRATNRAA